MNFSGIIIVTPKPYLVATWIAHTHMTQAASMQPYHARLNTYYKRLAAESQAMHAACWKCEVMP